MKTLFYTILLGLFAACVQAQQVYPPATQAQVNAGVSPNTFVSPNTLAGWAGSSTYATNFINPSSPTATFTNIVWNTNKIFVTQGGDTAYNLEYDWNVTINAWTNGTKGIVVDVGDQALLVGAAPFASLTTGNALSGLADDNPFTATNVQGVILNGAAPAPFFTLGTNGFNVTNNIALIQTNSQVNLGGSSITYGMLGNTNGYIKEFDDAKYLLPSAVANAVLTAFQSSLPTNFITYVSTNGNDGTAKNGDPAHPYFAPNTAFGAVSNNGLVWFEGYCQSNHITTGITLTNKTITVVLNQNILGAAYGSFTGFTLQTNLNMIWYGGELDDISFTLRGGVIACNWTKIGNPKLPTGNVDCFVFNGRVWVDHCYLWSTFDTFNNFPPNLTLDAYILDSMVVADESRSANGSSTQARCYRNIVGSGSPGQTVIRNSTLIAVGSTGSQPDANECVEISAATNILDNVTLFVQPPTATINSRHIAAENASVVYLKNMPYLPTLIETNTGTGVITTLTPFQ